MTPATRSIGAHIASVKETGADRYYAMTNEGHEGQGVLPSTTLPFLPPSPRPLRPLRRICMPSASARESQVVVGQAKQDNETQVLTLDRL